MRALALTSALACAACGASRPSPEPDAGPCAAPPGAEPPPAALVSFRASYASAACARLARCAPSDLGEPVASCASGWGADEAKRAFGPCAEQALRVGRVAFDPAMADACIAVLAESVCDDAAGALCGSVLRGRAAPGAYCGDEAGRRECATGTCNGEGCDSTCGATLGIEPGGLGEPCTSAGCVPPLVCSGGTCALPGEGEPCTTGCRPGLACLRPLVSPIPPRGTCGTPRGAGEACIDAFGDECSVGLACRARTCMAYRGEGEPCEGGAGQCGPGLYCTAICPLHPVVACGSGTCAARPTGVGEACAQACGIVGGHDVECVDGAKCFGRDLACSGIGSTMAPVGWGTCFSSPDAVDTLDCRTNACPVGSVCRNVNAAPGPSFPIMRCLRYEPPHACPAQDAL